MKKQFDSYEFTHICRIEPRREASGAIQQFLPQARYKNARGYMLHAYGNGPFCKFRIPREHHQEGVYILTVDDQPYYVGE